MKKSKLSHTPACLDFWVIAKSPSPLSQRVAGPQGMLKVDTWELVELPGEQMQGLHKYIGNPCIFAPGNSTGCHMRTLSKQALWPCDAD